MKSVVLSSSPRLICFLALPLALLAQADLPTHSNDSVANGLQSTSTADVAWQSLLVTKKTAEQSNHSESGDPAARKLIRETRADLRNKVATEARKFYASHPDHPLAGEARKIEAFALIEAVVEGDDSEAKVLAARIGTIRADQSMPAQTRAHVVSAYEFTKAVQGLTDDKRRKAAVEKAARAMIAEFPREAPGYQALLTLARAGNSEQAINLAQIITASSAPDTIKADAQTILDREALLGRPLAEVLGQDDMQVLSEAGATYPAIMYSWASWGSRSLEFGRMIQERQFNAISVCLDEVFEVNKPDRNLPKLGGLCFYDVAGRNGRLAKALKFDGAGQIYLIDAQGIIRDVRGGEAHLESKLKSIGIVSAIPEPARQR
jgi:hypothetical protein